jgi:hypothetical protein
MANKGIVRNLKAIFSQFVKYKKKGMLEIAESICYNMPRQKRYECSSGATKTPRGRNSWGFLFRFGKGGLCPRLVANYSSLSNHLQM